MEQTTITKTQENTELTRDLFTFVEQDDAGAEKMYAPSISYWQDAWRRLKQNRVAMASLLFILVLTAFAIVAPMMSSSTHSDVDFGVMNQGLSAEHWFGTDNLGRDLWCRVWMGARVSLFIALVAAVVQSTIGIIIGGVSGFFGGKIDLFLMRASDISRLRHINHDDYGVSNGAHYHRLCTDRLDQNGKTGQRTGAISEGK